MKNFWLRVVIMFLSPVGLIGCFGLSNPNSNVNSSGDVNSYSVVVGTFTGANATGTVSNTTAYFGGGSLLGETAYDLDISAGSTTSLTVTGPATLTGPSGASADLTSNIVLATPPNSGTYPSTAKAVCGSISLTVTNSSTGNSDVFAAGSNNLCNGDSAQTCSSASDCEAPQTCVSGVCTWGGSFSLDINSVATYEAGTDAILSEGEYDIAGQLTATLVDANNASVSLTLNFTD